MMISCSEHKEHHVTNNIKYIKDQQTDLYFAVICTYGTGIGVSNINYSTNISKMEDLDITNITYIKDKQSGMCFAIIHTYGTGIGMASVPCTEKVLKKIVE